MSFINCLKVLFLYGMILVGATVGLFFAISPAIPFIILNRKIYFRWCSFVMGYFLLMITCVLEDLMNVKIVVTGDGFPDNRKCSLIVLNHRTRLDWMFVWLLQSRYDILKQLKIVLKAQLKHIPVIGWGIQHAGFLFLERTWTKDQQTMKNMMNYYKSCKSPISLLIFPEGTNLSITTKRKSNDYASKQATYNRPYDYCLHPRVTGFTYLLKMMRSEGMVDYVDDITVGYEGCFPLSEFDLLKGVIPKMIHFHVKRYPINDLPQEDEQIGKWLQDRWEEKENLLKEFYTNHQLASPSMGLNNEHMEVCARSQRRMSFILWTLFILFWSYCFIAYIKIKLFVIIACIFHVVLEVFAHGVSDFVCQIDENYRKQLTEKHK